MSLILRRCLGVLAALVLLAGVAFAQSEDLDYGAWDEVATRAEQVLGDNDATDSALEGLRQSVVDWRERFLSGQGINAPRIDTLQAQIDALGPVPAEGETEPEDIATRRENLNAQLAELQAPGLRAQEAYTRADGIIRQIDTMIRTRQTDALLTLGPTPLNPQLWPAALEEVLSAGSSLFDEIRSDLASEVKLAEARESLPLILLLLALAGLLVIRGPRVMRGFGERLRASTRRGTGVWRFFVSLGGILVPLAGVMLLVAAVQTSDLPGTQGSELLQMLPAWTFLLLYIRWLAEQSFNRDPEVATVPLAGFTRVRGALSPRPLAVYRSRHSNDDGPLGRGWKMNFDRRLVGAGNGDLIFEAADQRQWRFTRLASGGYATPAGLRCELTRANGGGWQLREKVGIIYEFDVEGLFVAMRDTNGNRTRFLRDADGLLTEVIDDLGRSTTFTYDGSSHLTTVTDFSGRAWSFGYNGTASGTFTNCTGGGASFGNSGDGLGGKFYFCSGGTDSFSGTGGPTIGYLLGQRRPLSVSVSVWAWLRRV